MTVRDEVESFQSRQRDAVRSVVAVVLSRWRQVDPDQIAESWEALLPQVAGEVSAAQLRAAEAGAEYVPAAVRAQGVDPDPAGRVNARAFAGQASDGRPLDTLLALPSGQTLNRIGQGQSTEEALAYGRHKAGVMAATQVMDAGRMAASVGMTADRTVTGYRRQLRGESCDRCAILAGKWFRWNEGFARHPQCDCVHVPATGPKGDVRGLEGFDPQAYFDSLSAQQQARRFTKDGAAAIREGADMNRVVNARRGMRSTRGYGGKVSSPVSSSTRAEAGRRVRAEVGTTPAPRPSPERIYADASSRDDAIERLGRSGYLD